MPLDGHSYLVSQGWGGKGTGLREGAINRPIIIAQKKTLAGVGKDRDEAFPFWDHLFSAAASSIKLKICDSDDEESSSSSDDGQTKDPKPTLTRTQTGIISHRRPPQGTPATSESTSGSATPLDEALGPRYSLLTKAKRESARRGLYSRFFRGATLAPDIVVERGVKDASPKPQYAVDEVDVKQRGCEEEEDTNKKFVKAMTALAQESHATIAGMVTKKRPQIDGSSYDETPKKKRKRGEEGKKAKKEKQVKDKGDEKEKTKMDKKSRSKSCDEGGPECSERKERKKSKKGKERKEKRSSKSKVNDVDRRPPLTTDDRAEKNAKGSSKKRKRSNDADEPAPSQNQNLSENSTSDLLDSPPKKKRVKVLDNDTAPPKKKKKKRKEDSTPGTQLLLAYTNDQNTE